MLHLEIITERLRREFNLVLIVTTPSINYLVKMKNGKQETIYSPHKFPDDGNIIEIMEPWVTLKVITPTRFVSQIVQLL